MGIIDKKGNFRNLKPWQKGQSGNPSGRPRLPEDLKKVKAMSSEEVQRIIAKYMRFTKGQLQKVIKEQSDELPMFDALICSILANAYKSGDYSKVEFLLMRSIGKVKDTMEVVHPEPVIIQRLMGEQIVLGTIDSNDEGEE